MKRKKLIIGAAILVAVGAGIFVKVQVGGRHDVKYSEVAVKRDDIRLTILSTGIVQPENRLDVKPPIAGRLEQLLVVEGQHVRRGQIMAWMSSTERAALLDTARAKGDAEVKYWEDAYKATPILAPVNGVIILKNVERGQTITATDAILTMSDRLLIKAQVDETDLSEVKLGQSVSLTLDAYAKKALAGKVMHIAYDAKTVNSVTTYEVDILPQTVPDYMKSGMTANVSFLLAERQESLVVPAAAVHREGHKNTVLVAGANPGEPPQTREVKVGISDGKRVEVIEGLAEGDKVLVAKVEGLAKRGDRQNNPFSPMGGAKGGGGGGRGH